MTGGEISGNYTCGSTVGGGAYNDCTFDVGGTAKITGNVSGAIFESGTASGLTAFSDANDVSGWAVSAAQYNVGSGLIVGNNGQLRPNAPITRAESATVVLRLLQKAGLVDVRSAA